MAFVRAALSIEGVTDPLPPPVVINAALTLRLAFANAGGAAVAVNGAALLISRPDGVELAVPAGTMDASGTGVWLYTLLLDQGGQWRFRAACDDAATPDLPVTVTGSALSPALPTGPILVDETGLPLVPPEGGLLTLVRVDRTPEAASLPGLKLVGVQDEQARHITGESLQAAAEQAGADSGGAEGAATGAAAGTAAGATSGAAAGATAGATAGASAGAAAAQPVIAAAAGSATTATQKASEAAASQAAADAARILAQTSEAGAAGSALAALTSANGVTLNATNAGDFAVFKSLGGRVVARIKRATGALETMGLTTRAIAATSASVSGPVSAASLTAPTTQTANANLQTSGRAGQFLVRSLGGRVTLWLDSMAVLRGVGANFRTIATGSLTVGGQPITAPVAPAVYAPVTVSAATIADLNTWVAGMTLPGDVVALPGTFSTDAVAYGWRYAWLASSPAVTGRRHWVIAYGQNTRPGDGGEGTGGFCFLRYCDDLSANVWYELLYILPASPSGANGDPQLRTLADGRLLVMYSSGPTGGYGFTIQNPEAVKGSFDIGRTYFLDRGTPMKPEYAGTDLRGLICRSGDAGWQYYGSLTFSGRDAVTFTRISSIPLLATGYNNFPETSIVPISGGRTRAWFRTNGYGTYKTLSDIGDAGWNTAAPWTDYVNNGGSRASFARSPYSGYIYACWNRNATARRNLSIAYSANDGETFTGMVEVESRVLSVQTPQYPILTFANGWIYWSYDFGRDQAAQLGPQTILARIREDKVIAGTATEADVEKYIAATAGVIP